MRNVVILICAALFFLPLGGCQISTDNPKNSVVTVNITGGSNINPGNGVKAQPLRVCIFETSRAGWDPPGLYAGRICDDAGLGKEVLQYQVYILLPNRHLTYRSPITGQQERWLVVGAEFQTGAGQLSLIERRVEPDANFNMEINADFSSLSAIR
ncbi:MAG: type VI secretion lipoprotein TssJ [Rouxiella aceris]|uniref:type VI secretion lipoprotein TssJ n=1 Tax=Rouxiella aceris TaxID=2703884 RepID=UPI00284D7F4E|nr:type VI secretion lipoprotein TssJ [Rouxiella aceris]MDR3434554.1 type VI secretion lipoprotein TssJ [Rouxiella aceris]